MRIPRIPLLAIGAALCIGAIGGYAYAASATLPMVSSVTVPAPVMPNTLGVVRVDVPDTVPSGVNCGPKVYVQLTGLFGGVQKIAGACVNLDVAADARTDDVANAIADEN